jgi:vanillate O-demethylase monooxygenase subunit
MSTYQVGDLPIIETRGSAGFLCDNFIDLAHFPFLHASTFAAEDAVTVGPAEITYTADGFCATYTHEFSNREDPGVLSGERPLLQQRKLTYRYFAPFTLTLTIEFLTSGGTNVIGFFIQPVHEEECRIFSTLWRDDLGGDASAMDAAVDFELAIIEEDLWLQRQMTSLHLPLDPKIEVHTRADAMTLALRKVLREHLRRVDEKYPSPPLSPLDSRISPPCPRESQQRDLNQPTTRKARER